VNYFTEKELSCPCCGVNGFSNMTKDRLNRLRKIAMLPMPVTSGYRCPEYNRKNGYTQTHATGQAVDVACTHEQAYALMSLAIAHGFTGIGVKQKGKGRFLHLDDLEAGPWRPRPHVWSY